ncbi:MAG: M1 family aminopeptidase [Acidobacteriota bacterium]
MPRPQRVPSAALSFLCAIFVVAGFCLGAASAQGATLRASLRAFEAPLVGEAMPLEAPLAIGRGVLQPSSGGSAHLLWANGQPAGLWVRGGATFSYRVDDPISRPVAERNFKTASSVKLTAGPNGATASQRVTSAVIWARDLAAAKAAEIGATGPPEGAAALSSDWFTELLDRALFSSPGLRALTFDLMKLDGTRVALLEGDEKWFLDVDPEVLREETLLRLDDLSGSEGGREYKGDYIAYELVTQPIGRNWWDRPAAECVTTHTAFTVNNPRDQYVEITARSTVRSQRDDLGVWRVSLRDRVSDGDKFFPIEVDHVKVDGKEVDFLHDRNDLLVILDPPMTKGENRVIEVKHHGEIAIRPNKDSFWSLGTWAWYPRPALNGQFSTFEFEVRVPEPLTPYASGKTVERSSGDGFNRVKTRLDQPMQFPVVVAGKYSEVKDSMNDISGTVAAYAGGKERAAKQLLSNFFASADYYGQLFGVPYPLDEMNVVEINSWGFGQAPPGIIFITREAYNPIGDVVNRFFSQGVNARFVHEVAHTWWGHVIKMDSYEEQWLTESFADYSAALALQAMRGGGKKGQREFDRELRQWKRLTQDISDTGSIYLANRLAGKDDKDFRDRVYLLYAKGPLVLHALRQELGRQFGGAQQGDRYFFALLRTFTTNFSVQYGATHHLVGILNQMTNKDWQPWFERYVYGTETPSIDD